MLIDRGDSEDDRPSERPTIFFPRYQVSRREQTRPFLLNDGHPKAEWAKVNFHAVGLHKGRVLGAYGSRVMIEDAATGGDDQFNMGDLRRGKAPAVVLNLSSVPVRRRYPERLLGYAKRAVRYEEHNILRSARLHSIGKFG